MAIHDVIWYEVIKQDRTGQDRTGQDRTERQFSKKRRYLLFEYRGIF